MSVVYFSEDAFDNILEKENIPDIKLYNLILRKKCCKKIYFPKNKVSFFEALEGDMVTLEALDVDSLSQKLTDDQYLRLEYNEDFKDLFKDLIFNIDYFDDILGYDLDDVVKLFILNDEEVELKKNISSEGFQVETLDSLGAKDMTKLTTEHTVEGNWKWIKKRVIGANTRMIWIDRYLISNLLFHWSSEKFIKQILSIEEDIESFQLISDDQMDQIISDLMKIKSEDFEGRTNVNVIAIIRRCKKFSFNKEKRYRLIKAYLLQSATCYLSEKVYPVFFKNLKSQEKIEIDVFYSSYYDEKYFVDLDNLFISNFDVEEISKITKTAFEIVLEKFNIESNVRVHHAPVLLKSKFSDRYIVTNNFMIKAKTKNFITLQPDITITYNHFKQESEYKVIADRAGIQL